MEQSGMFVLNLTDSVLQVIKSLSLFTSEFDL